MGNWHSTATVAPAPTPVPTDIPVAAPPPRVTVADLLSNSLIENPRLHGNPLSLDDDPSTHYYDANEYLPSEACDDDESNDDQSDGDESNDDQSEDDITFSAYNRGRSNKEESHTREHGVSIPDPVFDRTPTFSSMNVALAERYRHFVLPIRPSVTVEEEIDLELDQNCQTREAVPMRSTSSLSNNATPLSYSYYLFDGVERSKGAKIRYRLKTFSGKLSRRDCPDEESHVLESC